ncbi:MAG: GNAT family N-acetyltransferase [Planctomycetales bacterium]|nr:GNAT family N-acetyltransferase [Planctomycetales bacterium]MBN8628465.1 GNAT family N-acetyltransferase [Planctomycetota bacterium]
MLEPKEVPGITVRPFAGPDDVAAWLDLRTAAFANLVAAGRPWTAEDFHREFTAKPWWSPDALLLATSTASRERERPESKTSLIGAISLGRTGRPPHETAAVQWLMVHPDHRRRGIARLLLRTLEAEAWRRGDHALTLETHASWNAATELYRNAGYVPA